MVFIYIIFKIQTVIGVKPKKLKRPWNIDYLTWSTNQKSLENVVRIKNIYVHYLKRVFWVNIIYKLIATFYKKYIYVLFSELLKLEGILSWHLFNKLNQKQKAEFLRSDLQVDGNENGFLG